MIVKGQQHHYATGDSDVLMKGVAAHLMSSLTKIGQQAVDEITREAQRRSVPPDFLGYVFWALTTQPLPLSAKDKPTFELMISILTRTGTLPNVRSRFQIPTDPAVDEAVDTIGAYMGQWSRQTMLLALLQAYQRALLSQVSGVARATGQSMSRQDAIEFLRRSFRQVLGVRSRMFSDGELLRRVIRALPI